MSCWRFSGRWVGHCLAVICLGVLGVQAGRAEGAPSKEIASPKAVRFESEWLKPYLSHGPGAAARRALDAQDPARAAGLLQRYLKRKTAVHRPQAQFLLAHALLETDKPGAAARAAALFTELIGSYPRLEQYHRYFAAKARYRLKQFDVARALAAAVPASAAIHGDAQLLLADAYRALGRHGEGAAIWRAYLQRHPGGRQVGRAHYRIAEAAEREALALSEKDTERRRPLLEEAIEHYKHVLVSAPLWRGADLAEGGLKRTAALLPDGAERAALTVMERYKRAVQLFLANRNEPSEAGFAGVLKDQELSDDLRCKASYYHAKSVYKQRERVRAAPLFAVAEAACRKAGKSDLVVKSLYNQGRGLANAKELDRAIARFGAIEKEFSSHTYADDARLWIAEIEEKRGNGEAVKRLLSTLPETYPGGDMTREALWRLARQAYLDKDYDEALTHLDRIVDKLGRARAYYAKGQALYWRARIHDIKGAPGRARASYEACIRTYPLSYYALMAFNRLRERHKSTYQALYRELLAPVGRGAGRWAFSPRPLFGKAGFLRGVELARLGFDALAARELNRVGLRVRRGEPEADLWLTAVLYDRAGLWRLSHQVGRSIDTAYQRSYPLGETYRKWAIGYPQAFHPLVPKNARAVGLPWELIQSVMREESGFDTTIESYANAVGLMQLILPTARAAGSQHKLEVNRRRLHDPTVNIKLGATYLGYLYRTFGCYPLTISGYNAGEGATYRWVKKFGKVPLDELIERIPYDQTRRYTKRVLSTLFTYTVLYGERGDRVPRIPQRIGKVTLNPFKK